MIGRFAPSPTGQLHFGSLTTAVASYCHIRSLKTPLHSQSTWLVRIEDTDIQRCRSEFSDSILHDLTNLGLHWDGSVVYQSQRSNIYHEFIHDLLRPYVYACQCSRKDLKEHALYPKFCQHQSLDWHNHKLRIQLPDSDMIFHDHIQGQQSQNPQQSLGDMVICRANTPTNQQRIINYILAVSIDDGLQGVTHIMRGLDILPMTSAQMTIMQQANLSQINHWSHLPLVYNQHGQKLSKQNLAQPIDTSSEHKCSALLAMALDFLQQPKVDLDTPERMLAQAIEQFNINDITKKNTE